MTLALFLLGPSVPAIALSLPPAQEPTPRRADPLAGTSTVDEHEHRVLVSTVDPYLQDPEPLVETESPEDAESSEQLQTRIEALIADLEDDDVAWNAMNAQRELWDLGVTASPFLEGALDSPDEQQRHLAASMLRSQASLEVSDRLLRVSVEALSSNFNLTRIAGRHFKSHSFHFLLRHGELARRPLQDGLYNGDRQQRFLCAFLLAKTGCRDPFWVIAETLVPHLRHNNIMGDGMMAAHGLYCLGSAVLTILDRSGIAADGQASRLLKLIELDLLWAPRSRSELRARAQRLGMRDVTSLYHDPVLEYDPTRSLLPSM
ncbi:MAG: hypothetical protein VX951_13145 [Planctomycetota bacterium]|nr:hypothetical protein [Planctomycetota bacterium]